MSSPAPELLPELLLASHLKRLKLPTFLREHDKLARQCAAEGVDHVRYLARLVELELIERERRMVELVPPGRYVLAKRFSSKEEKRRLVVSVYDAEVPAAFDNKLNFFHRAGAGLPDEIALGLAAFLNSTAVDDYFRLFSGHTQVNATDLRNLHYPSLEDLERLGRAAPVGQDAIDAAVEAIL